MPSNLTLIQYDPRLCMIPEKESRYHVHGNYNIHQNVVNVKTFTVTASTEINMKSTLIGHPEVQEEVNRGHYY